MSAFDLTQATADAKTYMMPNTCTIVTVTEVPDGAGSYTTTEASVTSRCRFTPASGDEAGEDQVRERGSYRLALPLTVAIAATSKVTFAGRQYQVIWTPPPNAWAFERIVGLEDA